MLQVLENSENLFLKLIIDYSSQGIAGSHLYQRQTNLLFDCLGSEEIRIHKFNNCTKIDCSIYISHAVKHIFTDFTSCEEISECLNGCSKVKKSRTVICVSHSQLLSDNFKEEINEKMNLPPYECNQCSGMISTKLTSIGKNFSN